MKTLFTLLITLFVVIASYGQTATAPSGSGTSGDPYLVATLNNLYWVTQNSSSSDVTLMAGALFVAVFICSEYSSIKAQITSPTLAFCCGVGTAALKTSDSYSIVCRNESFGGTTLIIDCRNNKKLPL